MHLAVLFAVCLVVCATWLGISIVTFASVSKLQREDPREEIQMKLRLIKVLSITGIVVAGLGLIFVTMYGIVLAARSGCVPVAPTPIPVYPAAGYPVSA